MKTLLTLALAAGVAISVAPPAAADETAYLDRLSPTLAFLSPDQLRTEGYKACRYVGARRTAGDAVPVVMKDLQITSAAAVDIVAVAVRELDC